ncbi:hypothetical protein LCM27_16855, partial [Ruegeria marisrubri]|uniref:hypothetical protein n=1 Tax=Ruegeria marisrubri TaxID=1685379 RepID=UPI001CD36CBE
ASTEDTAPAEEKVVERVVEKRGGFVPALLGGAIAAAVGFALGNGGLLSTGSDSSDTLATLESKLADQSDQIAKLSQALANSPDDAGLTDQVKALSDKLTPVESDLSAIKSTVDTLSGQIGPLSDRIATLEKTPIESSVSPESMAAFEAELKKLQDSLASQRAEVEKMVSDAQALEAKASAEAQAAANAAVLSRLHGQLDAGQPYSDLVAELKAGGVDVPDALSGPAEKGVETLSSLRDSFEPAARTALAEAREADKGTGLIAFLQRQTGARSVTPQEGDGPDAVLSRAQAALADGDLAKALSELKSLPEAAQAAMADWEQAAQTRVAAVDAANTLASSLNSN